jgi:hypothetical protein
VAKEPPTNGSQDGYLQCQAPEVTVPPFDLLTKQEVPYVGFGDVLLPSADRDRALLTAVEKALVRAEEGFKLEFATVANVPSQIDKLVDEMWAQGWNPDAGNVNLFATDFGLILAKTISSLLGGVFVFRSESDISHLSLWWPNKKLEAFPFHKIIKRLYRREGESVGFFVAGLSRLVTP